jgi:hypothetical protein
MRKSPRAATSRNPGSLLYPEHAQTPPASNGLSAIDEARELVFVGGGMDSQRLLHELTNEFPIEPCSSDVAIAARVRSARRSPRSLPDVWRDHIDVPPARSMSSSS